MVNNILFRLRRNRQDQFFEIPDGRTRDDFTLAVESRAMAGAIKGFFGRVPSSCLSEKQIKIAKPIKDFAILMAPSV